jgi:hypothetical protein
MITKTVLSEEEIQQNYKEFIEFVDKQFKGERRERLLKMYNEENLGLSVATSPASGTDYFHLCHPGGYIQHIMNVVKLSFIQKKVFEIMGGVPDWTDEEMVFAALHHDLGKLGDPEFGKYYVTQTESWKTRKGELYKLNPNLPYMEVTDRAIYLLQKYGITLTWREYFGIKLSDGIYNESNKKYLIQYNPDLVLKTDLPKIIHFADHMACVVEHNLFKNFKVEETI